MFFSFGGNVMKSVTGNAGTTIFLACLAATLTAGVVSAQEPIIGTVQTSFVVTGWDSVFNKKAVNTQARIRLLGTAQEKYPGTIDITDIVWVSGKSEDNQNKEIVATGKVVQVSAEESGAGSARIGMVQTSFAGTAWDSLFNKKAINTQAYIRLLEAAKQKYPDAVDITDIIWVTGKSVDHQNTEIVASGKVIQAN
jgi:hypothetical protein